MGKAGKAAAAGSGLGLLKRNTVCVSCKPRIESLQRWIKCTTDLIAQDRSDQSATLFAGCTYNCDSLILFSFHSLHYEDIPVSEFQEFCS